MIEKEDLAWRRDIFEQYALERRAANLPNYRLEQLADITRHLPKGKDDEALLAKGYRGPAGPPVPYSQIYLRPAGNLHTSALELGRFVHVLLNWGETDRLGFNAPAEPGEYPFLCTFPGHWVRMYGVMLVVSNLDAWEANRTVPNDPMTNRPFDSQRH